MRIALGRGLVAVPQERADQDQAVPGSRRHAGERVAQVVQANIIEARTRFDALPGPWQAHKVRPFLLARQDVGIAL